MCIGQQSCSVFRSGAERNLWKRPGEEHKQMFRSSEQSKTYEDNLERENTLRNVQRSAPIYKNFQYLKMSKVRIPTSNDFHSCEIFQKVLRSWVERGVERWKHPGARQKQHAQERGEEFFAKSQLSWVWIKQA